MAEEILEEGISESQDQGQQVDQEQVDQQEQQVPSEPPKKLSVKEFAAKIKAKYPTYSNVDDNTLVSKMIDKYPIYKDKIELPGQEQPKPTQKQWEATSALSPMAAITKKPEAQPAPVTAPPVAQKEKHKTPSDDTFAQIVDAPMFGGLGTAIDYGKHVWNKLVETGASIPSGAAKGIIRVMAMADPKNVHGGAFGGLPEDEFIKETDKLANQIKESAKGIELNVDERRKKDFENSFVASAVASIPSLALQASIPYGLGFASSAFDSAIDNINNSEEGKKLPESLKTIYGTANAASIAILSEIGLDKIVGGKLLPKLSSKLTAETITDLLGKSSEPITKEAFEIALKSNAGKLKNSIVNNASKLGHSAAVGSAFMGANEALNIMSEKMVNRYANKNVFEPTSFGKDFMRVVKAGAEGAAFGLTLGGVHLPFAKADNYIKDRVAESKSPQDIDALKNDIAENLKTGKINQQQSDIMTNLVDQYASIHSSIPSDVPNKAQVIDKIKQSNDLRQEAQNVALEAQNLHPAFQEQKLQEAQNLHKVADDIDNSLSGNPKYKIGEQTVDKDTFINFINSPEAEKGNIALSVENDNVTSDLLNKVSKEKGWNVNDVQEEGLPKATIVNKKPEYDTENITGVPSEIGIGKEPIQAQPIEGGGAQEISGGGVLQENVPSGEGKVEEKPQEVADAEADIERRRQEELVPRNGNSVESLLNQGAPKEIFSEWEKASKERSDYKREDVEDKKKHEEWQERVTKLWVDALVKARDYLNNKINAKYGAELKALKEKQQAELPKVEEKPSEALKDVESTNVPNRQGEVGKEAQEVTSLKGENPRGGTWEEVITDKDGVKTTRFKTTRINKSGEVTEAQDGTRAGLGGREMTWDDFLNEFKPNDIDLEGITNRGTPKSVIVHELREGANGINGMTITVDWGKSESGINETSRREIGFDRSKPVELPKAEEKPKIFSIDNKEDFYHGSYNKREGKLRTNTAEQFGDAIYFTTSKEEAEGDYPHVTKVKLNIENPIYAGEGKWDEVEKLALEKENANKERDEDGNIIGEVFDLADIKNSKNISDAAKELGYDAIILRGQGNHENETAVLNPSKVIYPEDVAEKQAELPKAKETGSVGASVGVGGDGEKSILKSDVDLKGDKKMPWMRKNSLDRISVNDINEEGHNNNLSAAKENVKAGKKSQTRGAPLVEIDENGNATIIDGHHRIAEGILNGKSHIEAFVDNKFNIRDAIKDGLYEKAISEGRMTAKDAKEIIESAGLKVPKEISEQSLKETPKAELPKQKETPSEPIQPTGEKASGAVQPTPEVPKGQEIKAGVQPSTERISEGKTETTTPVLKAKEGELPLNKDNVAPFETKSKKQIVKRVGELLEVTDKNGKKVSRETEKKALREYAKAFDFSVGELADEDKLYSSSSTTRESWFNQKVEASENPLELAEIYVNEEPTMATLSTTEVMIGEYGISNIKPESFAEYNDKNNITLTLAKRYLSRGKGFYERYKADNRTGLDVVAKEMSDHYFLDGDGTEISPSDLADFMVRFPSGNWDKLTESEVAYNAADKFQKLTGLILNREIADIAIENEVKKLDAQEKKLLENEYKNQSELEADYWDTYAKTDGFTKEIPISEVEQKAEIKGKPTEAAAELPKESTKPSKPRGKQPGKYESLMIEANKKIDEIELPSFLKADIGEAKKAGLGEQELKDMLKTAMVTMGRLMDKGVEFSEALKVAVKDLVKSQGEENRDNIEKGFASFYKENTGEKETEVKEPDGGYTGVKKSITKTTRELLGLPKVELPKMGKDVDELNAAKERVDSGESNPRSMVDDIIKNDRGYKDEKEVMDMQYYAHQLNAKDVELSKMLADADNDVDKATVLGLKQQLSDEIDRQTEAAQKAGNKWGKIGKTMQPIIDEGFNISREVNTIKDAYGGELPSHVKEKIDSIKKERDEAIAEKEKIEKKLIEERAKKEIEKKAKEIKASEGKEPKAKKTKEEYIQERKSIIERIKKKWNDVRRDKLSYSTIVPLPIEKVRQLTAISPEVGELIKSHIAEGIDKVNDIVDSVHSLLKDEIDGLTKKDIIDLISGKYNVSKERSEMSKKVAEIRSEAKKLQKENRTNDEKINDEVDRLNKKADNLEEKIKSTPSSKFKEEEFNPYDNSEWVKADQRVVNAEKKMRDLKREAFESQKNWYQKSLMWLGRGVRLSVLSGYHVLGKLGAAATIGSALRRMPEQAIGSIYNIAFKGIAEKAPIEGSSMSLKSELKWYKEFFNPKKFAKNAWDILKTGTTYLNKRMGKSEHEHVPVLYLPTDLHQIIKDPVKRSTFEQSRDNGMRWAAKQGLDINNDLVIQSVENAAFKRAEYEIFQESNALTRKFTAWKNEMEKKGNVGSTAKFLADFMIPVSSVPTNIARRLGIVSPFGLLKGYADVVKSYREGIEKLEPEQADKVMRQLKQGTLGTALWLIGWYGVSHFGGLYTKFNPNKKRDEDLSSDEMMVGGKEIPKPIQHALPLEIIQLAATSRRLWDKYNEDAEVSTPEAIYKAGLGSIGAVAEQIPIVETPVHMVMATQDPYESKLLQKDIKRRFEPQILRETGIISDDKVGKMTKEQESKLSSLINNEINIPQLGKIGTLRLKITKQHPEGKMSKEEYDKLEPLVNKYSVDYYDKFIKKEQSTISKMNKLKESVSTKDKVKFNQLKRNMQDKINELHKKAIDKAKSELKLH